MQEKFIESRALLGMKSNFSEWRLWMEPPDAREAFNGFFLHPPVGFAVNFRSCRHCYPLAERTTWIIPNRTHFFTSNAFEERLPVFLPRKNSSSWGKRKKDWPLLLVSLCETRIWVEISMRRQFNHLSGICGSSKRLRSSWVWQQWHWMDLKLNEI